MFTFAVASGEITDVLARRPVVAVDAFVDERLQLVGQRDVHRGHGVDSKTLLAKFAIIADVRCAADLIDIGLFGAWASAELINVEPSIMPDQTLREIALRPDVSGWVVESGVQMCWPSPACVSGGHEAGSSGDPARGFVGTTHGV